MTANRLTIVRGDDEIIDLSFVQPDGTTPLSLAGATGIWFTAKRHPSDADAEAVIRKALGAGISIVSEPGGTATVTIDAEDTAAARPGALVWDAQIRDAAGLVRTAASGSLTIEVDVTRAPHEIGVPVLVPPVPDTDGDVLTVVGGIPVWVPPTGGGGSGTGVATAVIDVAYADLALEDKAGALVDAEGDYASVGRIDLASGIPAEAIILGVTFDPIEAWDVVDPGFDADSAAISFFLGTTVSLDEYLGSISQVNELSPWPLWGVGAAPPVSARRSAVSSGAVVVSGGLSLVVQLAGLVAGNQRALLSDLSPEGVVRVTVFYVSAD